MSLDIASSILRKLSAWRSRDDLNSTRAILVSPSTRNATCSPNRRRSSSARGERVLERVVQQARGDRHLVHAQVDEDRGDLERMDQIGLAGEALLALVDLRREHVGALEQREVARRVVLEDAIRDVVEAQLRHGETHSGSGGFPNLPISRGTAAASGQRAASRSRGPARGARATVRCHPTRSAARIASTSRHAASRVGRSPRRSRSARPPRARAARSRGASAIAPRIVAAAPLEPLAQRRERRRQQEDEARVGAPLAHLARALHLDLEQQVAARGAAARRSRPSSCRSGCRCRPPTRGTRPRRSGAGTPRASRSGSRRRRARAGRCGARGVRDRELDLRDRARPPRGTRSSCPCPRAPPPPPGSRCARLTDPSASLSSAPRSAPRSSRG